VAKTNGYLIVRGESVQGLADSLIKLMWYRRRSKLVSKCLKDSILAYLSLDEDVDSFAVVHGKLFDHVSNFEKIIRFYENVKGGSDKITLQEVDGDFSLAIFAEDEVFAIRSPASSKTLYFFVDKRNFVLSSDPYPLKSNNLICQPIPPAHFLYVNFSKGLLLCKKYYENNPVEVERLEDAVGSLNSAIKYSLEKNLSGFKDAAVAFSGGIDSIILAKLLSLFDIRLHLITVCLKDSHDYTYSEKASSLLSIEHHRIVLDEGKLASKARSLSKIIGGDNLMNLSISIVLNVAAEEASKAGFKNLVVGQGADELFGGYRKYTLYAKRGCSLNEILKRDFERLQSLEISRDEVSVAMYCEPIFPYVNRRVAEAAFSTPMKYKIDVENDERKVVLRMLAKELGLPKEVYGKQKKAMQYSSGVQKVLAKLFPKIS